jgi:hypothetical protein
MGARRTKTKEEIALFGRKPKHEPVTEVKQTVRLEDIPIPHLIATDEGKLSLWNFICADLANRQLLNISYVMLIEMLIHDIAMYQTLLPQLEDEGTTYSTIDKHGNEIKRPNPMFTQVHLLKSSILQKLVSLGMTPRDIIYVTNPAATSQIEAVAREKKGITYFK